MNKKLNEVAAVDLGGSTSIAEMAQREGWSPHLYAYAMAEGIRDSGTSFDMFRERLAALAQVGAGLVGDQASAVEISRHWAILDATFMRLSRAAVEAMASDNPRSSVIAERYLNAALRVQKSAMACLSALKVLRDGNQPQQASPTTSTAMPAPVAAPATGAALAAK